MAVSFKVALRKSGLKPFKYRWVLIAACATFAWLTLRGTSQTAPAPTAATPEQTTAVSGGTPRMGAAGSNLTVTGQTADGAGKASPSGAASASFGMSTINVIVHHND